MTCQNAADVAATVLPRLCGRIARPCAHSTYTSTSSGRSPAQSASPKHRSARLTAAISAALVTLWEFVASHKPRFGHAKPHLHSFVRIVPPKRLRACRSCPVSRARWRALRVLASLEGSLRKLRFLRRIPVRLLPCLRRCVTRFASPYCVVRCFHFVQTSALLVWLAPRAPSAEWHFSRLTQLDTGHNRPASSHDIRLLVNQLPLNALIPLWHPK